MILAEFFIRHSWDFVALGGLLLLSAIFSGTETALFLLSRGQIEKLGVSGTTGRVAVKLLRRPNRLLNTLLLANMVVNVAFTATAAVMVIELEKTGTEKVFVIIASLVPLLGLILFGEVIPKMMAYSVAEFWGRSVAIPIFLVQQILSPILWVLENGLVQPLSKILAPRMSPAEDITVTEMSGLMGLSFQRGIIGHQTNDLLQEIIELTGVRAADVMVPRVDITAYDIDDGPEGLAKLFRETGFHKIPVYRGDLDKILGVIYSKRLLLEPQSELHNLVEPIEFLPESADLEKVLRRFRKTHKQMGIVVDEYGGTSGLITLKDVVEEIVGDFPNPRDDDRPPDVQKISDVEYLLAGDLPVREWAEAFNIKISHERVSTFGGLVTKLLGKIPQQGDTATLRNLHFTVEKMRNRRVSLVRVTLTGGEA